MMNPRALLFLALFLIVVPQPIWSEGDPIEALQFDGEDDFVRVPSDPSLGVTDAFSVEAWVHPDSVDHGGIVGMWGNGGLPDKLLLFIEGGFVHILITRQNDPANLQIGSPIFPGVWTHVAATYDGTSLRLYVDGVETVEALAPGSIPDVTLDLRMGIEDIFGSQPPNYLEGTLDEVRFWNVARTGAEILDARDCFIDPFTPGLVSY